jgi:hypothetical protein
VLFRLLSLTWGFSPEAWLSSGTAMLPTKAKIARRSFDDSQDFLKNFPAVDFQPDTGRRLGIVFVDGRKH